MEIPASRGSAGAGGDQQSIRLQGFNFLNGDFIIAKNPDILGSSFLQSIGGHCLDDVIGERIIIIYYNKHFSKIPSRQVQQRGVNPMIY